MRRGFTIIELLVVIAIIALLASIILVSLNTSRSKGRDARRIADLKQIQAALDLYAYESNGRYPATLNPLAPGYLQAIPVDPASGGPYAYACTPSGGLTGTSYHLGASLENNITSILDNDADFAGSGGVCTGSLSEFNELTTAGKCRATDPGNYCYDLRP